MQSTSVELISAGGIELLREWTAPWNSNPGPGSALTKAISEGKAKLEELVANQAFTQR
jgi:hypothetical protein